MSADGQDPTGNAFPFASPHGNVEFGMTYRQYLAAQFGARLMTDTKIVASAMRRFGDDVLARKKMAQATWMLVDFLLAEEHTDWPEGD